MVFHGFSRLAPAGKRTVTALVILHHLHSIQNPDSKLREQGKLGGNSPICKSVSCKTCIYSTAWWLSHPEKTCSSSHTANVSAGFNTWTNKSRSARNGGFLKQGYPQIIHCRVGLSLINHPFLGTPMTMETSKWLRAGQGCQSAVQTCCTVTSGLGLNPLQDLFEWRGVGSTNPPTSDDLLPKWHPPLTAGGLC